MMNKSIENNNLIYMKTCFDYSSLFIVFYTYVTEYESLFFSRIINNLKTHRLMHKINKKLNYYLYFNAKTELLNWNR